MFDLLYLRGWFCQPLAGNLKRSISHDKGSTFIRSGSQRDFSKILLRQSHDSLILGQVRVQSTLERLVQEREGRIASLVRLRQDRSTSLEQDVVLCHFSGLFSDVDVTNT